MMELTSSREITPEMIELNLYTVDSPPLDILIRTSGVNRLSDFLLWQVRLRFLPNRLTPPVERNDNDPLYRTQLARHWPRTRLSPAADVPSGLHLASHCPYPRLALWMGQIL